MSTGQISSLAVVETEEIGTNVTIAEYAVVRKGARIGKDVVIHPFVVIEPGVTVGDGVEIFPGSYIGKEPKSAGALAREPVFEPQVTIGAHCRVGPHAVIYYDVKIGESTLVGDGASVRERCRIGTRSVIGRQVTLNYDCIIGSRTKILDHSTMGGNMKVGDGVFMANDVQTANDNAMGRQGWDENTMIGPTIEDGAMIGAGAVLLPGIVIGKDAIVGAGAIVNVSVKPNGLMLPMPARAVPQLKREE